MSEIYREWLPSRQALCGSPATDLSQFTLCLIWIPPPCNITVNPPCVSVISGCYTFSERALATRLSKQMGGCISLDLENLGMHLQVTCPKFQGTVVISSQEPWYKIPFSFKMYSCSSSSLGRYTESSTGKKIYYRIIWWVIKINDSQLESTQRADIQ